jgi:hypothetical protein
MEILGPLFKRRFFYMSIGMDFSELGNKIVNNAVSIWNTAGNMNMQKLQGQLEQDRFAQDVREFGVTSALSKFAQVNGISIQKAQQVYNNLLQARQSSYAGQQSQQSLAGNDFAMRSTIEDKKRSDAFGKAFAKGAAIGMKQSLSNKGKV